MLTTLWASLSIQRYVKVLTYRHMLISLQGHKYLRVSLLGSDNQDLVTGLVHPEPDDRYLKQGVATLSSNRLTSFQRRTKRKVSITWTTTHTRMILRSPLTQKIHLRNDLSSCEAEF